MYAYYIEEACKQKKNKNSFIKKSHFLIRKLVHLLNETKLTLQCYEVYRNHKYNHDDVWCIEKYLERKMNRYSRSDD